MNPFELRNNYSDYIPDLSQVPHSDGSIFSFVTEKSARDFKNKLDFLREYSTEIKQSEIETTNYPLIKNKVIWTQSNLIKRWMVWFKKYEY